MEKCYEYFSCTKTDCPMYGRKDVNCWEIGETLCNHPDVELIQSKLSEIGKEKCEICIYYSAVREGKV